MVLIRFCTDSDRRLGSLEEIRKHSFFLGVDWDHIRDRPAAYQPRVKSIDDTSNFDDFPDVDLRLRMFFFFFFFWMQFKRDKWMFILAPPNKDSDVQVHDWLFMNYTYKRFDGLTAKPKLRNSTPSSNWSKM